jgi:hypothetical protein
MAAIIAALDAWHKAVNEAAKRKAIKDLLAALGIYPGWPMENSPAPVPDPDTDSMDALTTYEAGVEVCFNYTYDPGT